MKFKTPVAFLFVLVFLAASVMASSSTEIHPNPEGLIAYYPFDQCTGTSATDRGDWGNTGTLNGGANVSWASGKYGCGLSFTGVNAYVALPNVAILNFTTGSFTFSAWVYPLSITATQYIIFGKSNTAEWYPAIDLLIASNQLRFFNYNGSATGLNLYSNPVIVANKWQYVAVTYNTSHVCFYVDGVLQPSPCQAGTMPVNPDNVYAMYLGNQGQKNLEFGGYIDEPKFWNNAKSNGEIYIDYLGTYANIEAYYQSLTTGNITSAQNNILGNLSGNFTYTNLLIAYLNGNMSGNFTYSNGQILLVLGNQTYLLNNQTLILTNLADVNSTQNTNALQILNDIANMNSTQNANYNSLMSSLNLLNDSIISVNTTQNANYAQLQIEIIDVNSTQNTNIQDVLNSLSDLNADILSVNVTMLDNFSTIYSITLSINTTSNTILSDLLQMNQSLHAELLAINNSATSLSADLAAHNATMTSYYNLLLAAIQNTNSTQNSNYVDLINSIASQFSDLNGSIILASQNIVFLQGNVSLLQSDLNSTEFLMGSNFTDVSNRFSAMDQTLNETNTTVNSISSTVSGLAALISSLNGTVLSLNSTVFSLNNTVSQGFRIDVTSFPIIVAGKTYYSWVNVYDYQGIPTNLTVLPTITIYDPLRTKVVDSQPFAYSSEGLYSFSWATTSSSVTGLYESVITADYNGNIVNQSTFWTVSGSPADVVINSITDSTVPSITASVTIQNKGTQASDFEYIYCIVGSQDNLCGGSDDIAYQTGTHYVDAGDSWNTAFTLNVNSTGVYWFKVKAKALSESYWAGASIMFTASSPGLLLIGGGSSPAIPPQNATAEAAQPGIPAGAWLDELLTPKWIIASAFCFLVFILFISAVRKKKKE